MPSFLPFVARLAEKKRIEKDIAEARQYTLGSESSFLLHAAPSNTSTSPTSSDGEPVTPTPGAPGLATFLKFGKSTPKPPVKPTPESGTGARAITAYPPSAAAVPAIQDLHWSRSSTLFSCATTSSVASDPRFASAPRLTDSPPPMEFFESEEDDRIAAMDSSVSTSASPHTPLLRGQRRPTGRPIKTVSVHPLLDRRGLQPRRSLGRVNRELNIVTENLQKVDTVTGSHTEESLSSPSVYSFDEDEAEARTPLPGRHSGADPWDAVPGSASPRRSASTTGVVDAEGVYVHEP